MTWGEPPICPAPGIGPDAVVIETSLPEPGLGVSFVSTYLANPGAETIAAHASAGSQAAPSTWSRRISEAEIAGVSDRDTVLLDHLAQLHDVLIAGGRQLSVAFEQAPSGSHAAPRGE